MEPMAQKSNKFVKKSTPSFYQTIWRWHFFAGMFFTPILIMLSVTGAIYLFKPYAEPILYEHLYKIKAEQVPPLTASEQINAVKHHFPKSEVTVFKPNESSTSSSKVVIIEDGITKNIYINPYTGDVLGTQLEDSKIMSQILSLHGSLMIGTVGDRLIELAASWAIILLITGFYLYAPYYKKLSSLFRIRLQASKRILNKDIHTVIGFWLSLFILILILTGLPWAGFIGDKINQVATATQNGYPSTLWDSPPVSVIPTKEVAKTPWATENLPVPKSDAHANHNKHTQSTNMNNEQLSIDDVVKIATKQNIYKGYEINFPEGPTGVYTVSVFPMLPKNQATLHIDQYTGNILADVRFANYGWMAKTIEIGIALHEGRFFGLPNLIVGFITCVGLVGISLTGIIMWWKRRQKGTLGVPSKSAKVISPFIIALCVLLGICLPLAGVSILFVLALDFIILRRLPITKKILY